MARSDYLGRDDPLLRRTVIGLSGFPHLDPVSSPRETDLMDPYALLREHPDLTLCFDRLPRGERGRYYPDLNAIVISDRLSQAERRCTLTHELVHRMRGDFHVSDDVANHRQEKTCHETAARLLIPFPSLLAAMQWDRHPGELARELNVDEETLAARLCGLAPPETEQLMGVADLEAWGVA